MSTDTEIPIKRFALVNGGIVTNIVAARDPAIFTLDELVIEMPDLDGPSIGWTWDGSIFSPPPTE